MNKAIRKICCFAFLIAILSWPPLTAAKRSPLEIPKVTKDKIICFALYTVHNNIMKMTAQLYPLDANDPRTVRLEIKDNGSWVQIAESLPPRRLHHQHRPRTVPQISARHKSYGPQ